MAQNPAYEMIWQVIGAIPVGKVATYGQIAELAGIPGGARMVGRCLSQLPCDSQLLSSPGPSAVIISLIPVDSEGYKKQHALLQEEGVVVLSGRISLAKFRW